MNYEEALTWDDYQRQRFDSELGHAIILSSNNALSLENVNFHIKELGKLLGEFASQQGYRPSEKAKIVIKFPFSPLATCDPLCPHPTVAGKVECTLTATKDQYVLYASKIIEALKRECKHQIEKSWQPRLHEYLDNCLKEFLGLTSLEFYEVGESDNLHVREMKKLEAKIEQLVSDFVASIKE